MQYVLCTVIMKIICNAWNVWIAQFYFLLNTMNNEAKFL